MPISYRLESLGFNKSKNMYSKILNRQQEIKQLVLIIETIAVLFPVISILIDTIKQFGTLHHYNCIIVFLSNNPDYLKNISKANNTG